MTGPTPDRRPLLLDLDGTLVDTLPDIAASTNHVRSAFGLADAPLAAVRGWIGDGLERLLARALSDLGAFEPVRERALELYRRHHLEQCTRAARPFPGVEQHLAAWHERGRPLAVVTNKPGRFTHRILDHLGLRRWLPVVVAGDSLPQRKPDPAPLRAALAALDADHVGATMVGDGAQDLRAGKAAGVRTAAVLFGYGDPELLRAEGADEYWPAFGGEEGP